MVNTYAVQSGGCTFESLWGFGFFLKGAHYEVDYSGKNLLSWTTMHIDFVMCKKINKHRQQAPMVRSDGGAKTRRRGPNIGP